MFVHMKLCLFCDIFKPFSCHVTRINDKWDVFENIKPEGGGGASAAGTIFIFSGWCGPEITYVIFQWYSR